MRLSQARRVGLRWALPLLLGVVAAGDATRSAQAAPWVVKDIAGRRVDLADKSKKAIVLLFVARDCPISNAYAPEVNRLAASYGPKGMAFYIVYPEAGASAAQVRRHGREYGYRSPLLLDPARRLVKRAQVSVTPEVAVLAPGGELLYRGRIDDRYAALGRPRLKATRHDLRLALDAISANKPVPAPRTTAIGCYIEG